MNTKYYEATLKVTFNKEPKDISLISPGGYEIQLASGELVHFDFSRYDGMVDDDRKTVIFNLSSIDGYLLEMNPDEIKWETAVRMSDLYLDLEACETDLEAIMADFTMYEYSDEDSEAKTLFSFHNIRLRDFYNVHVTMSNIKFEMEKAAMLPENHIFNLTRELYVRKAKRFRMIASYLTSMQELVNTRAEVTRDKPMKGVRVRLEAAPDYMEKFRSRWLDILKDSQFQTVNFWAAMGSMLYHCKVIFDYEVVDPNAEKTDEPSDVHFITRQRRYAFPGYVASSKTHTVNVLCRQGYTIVGEKTAAALLKEFNKDNKDARTKYNAIITLPGPYTAKQLGCHIDSMIGTADKLEKATLDQFTGSKLFADPLELESDRGELDGFCDDVEVRVPHNMNATYTSKDGCLHVTVNRHSLEIKRLRSKDGTRTLADCVLVMQDYATGKLITTWTTPLCATNGVYVHRIDNVPEGRYTIREAKTPAGYTPISDLSFERGYVRKPINIITFDPNRKCVSPTLQYIPEGSESFTARAFYDYITAIAKENPEEALKNLIYKDNDTGAEYQVKGIRCITSKRGDEDRYIRYWLIETDFFHE